MTTFAEAVLSQETRTENGMRALKNTGNACTSLFFSIGASRGKDIIPQFVSAYVENPERALRVVQWARDIREGAGERQIFKDVLKYLEENDPEALKKLVEKIPELGRWDDGYCLETAEGREVWYKLVSDALLKGNGLAAKWAHRKGEHSIGLRRYMKLSPKDYRKLIVGLTKVVETKMCSNQWNDINFSQVPSLAHARYKKAFYKNASTYVDYVSSLVKKSDPKVKINAGAVYPYDVIKGLIGIGHRMSKTELLVVEEQWSALENFVGDASILPMVDVSGSMRVYPGGNRNSSTSCLDIAVSLGLYLSEKNVGKFKDLILTFSGNPSLVKLSGTIVQRCQQLEKVNWGMNTDLIRAMEAILDAATNSLVPQEEMPKVLLILSDMQFDQCAKFDDSAMEMITRKFENAGYDVPNIVFWNLNSRDNVPVKYDTSGVALVSGFSPTILRSILSVDPSHFTPEAIMLQTIMKSRYDI